MELRSLRYFQAVYEQGSVSGAARQCYVSQPSITAAIQQLESLLKVELFVRHARGVLPTAAADKLYPKAKEMSDNAQGILHLFSDGPTPVPLRLGIMRSLGVERMCYLLKHLINRIDNLELTLVDPEEPCDARIVFVENKASNEDFIPIWQDHYQLVLPITWPIVSKSVLSLHDLEAMPFINRKPCDALDKLKLMMTTAGVQFQSRANIRTIEYAWQLVNAGVGAALLPDWQEIDEAESVVFRDIEGVNIKKEIGLAFKTSKQYSGIIQIICDVCAEASEIC